MVLVVVCQTGPARICQRANEHCRRSLPICMCGSMTWAADAFPVLAVALLGEFSHSSFFRGGHDSFRVHSLSKVMVFMFSIIGPVVIARCRHQAISRESWCRSTARTSIWRLPPSSSRGLGGARSAARSRKGHSHDSRCSSHHAKPGMAIRRCAWDRGVAALEGIRQDEGVGPRGRWLTAGAAESAEPVGFAMRTPTLVCVHVRR
jgi:hypothetical protein